MKNTNINLIDLIPIQREVNEVVADRLGRIPNAEEYLVALNTEFFEYFNSIGTWKWWKHNHVLKQEKILDELADCFAFFLSLIISSHDEKLVNVPEEINIIEAFEKDVQNVYENLQQLKEEGTENKEIVNNMIMIIGTDNESGQVTSSIHRFAMSIFMAVLLFNIGWDEISQAYKEKSIVNINRQVENY